MDPNQPLSSQPSTPSSQPSPEPVADQQPTAPPVELLAQHRPLQPSAEFLQEMRAQAAQSPVTRPVAPAAPHLVQIPDAPTTPELNKRRQRSSFSEWMPAIIGIIIIIGQVFDLILMHTLTTMIVSLFEIAVAIGIIRRSNVARIIYIFLAIISLPALALAEGWVAIALSIHLNSLSAGMLYSARALAGPVLSLIGMVTLLVPAVARLFKQEI